MVPIAGDGTGAGEAIPAMLTASDYAADLVDQVAAGAEVDLERVPPFVPADWAGEEYRAGPHEPGRTLAMRKPGDVRLVWLGWGLIVLFVILGLVLCRLAVTERDPALFCFVMFPLASPLWYLLVMMGRPALSLIDRPRGVALFDRTGVALGDVVAVELKKNEMTYTTDSGTVLGPRQVSINYEVALASRDGRRYVVARTRDRMNAEPGYELALPLSAEVARMCGCTVRLVA